jgi:malonyl-CoA O-methyltransferase
MNPDKDLVRARFGRSLAGYDDEAALQREMARWLVEQIVSVGGVHHDSVFEIGCGTGLLSRALAGSLRIARFAANDLVPECEPRAAGALSCLPGTAFSFFPGDIERIALPPGPFDLMTSSAVFHWLDDLAGLLERLAGSLRVGGLLAFTTFGPENLHEVAAVGKAGLRYRSLDEVAALLGHRFVLRHCEQRREVLRFPSPRAVLEHLRRTGTNGLERGGWTRGKLRAFEAAYVESFGSGEAVTLTYHPMLFVAARC